MAEDQDLGERDNEEDVDAFPPEDRVIHTQGYDLSVNTLLEQWEDGTLVIPDFQREYVWPNPKASRLVESLLLNIPVPVLFFFETKSAKYEIVDGHQRVYSLVRYMKNEFALSGLAISQEFKGKRFHQLPSREQRFLRTRSMRAIVISSDSSPSMKFEVFERLNTGGLALNAQEIRNALYRGSLNLLLRELQQYPAFRSVLGTAKPRRRMVDQELVLRFIALHHRFAKYKTPQLRFLNDFMHDHRDPPTDWLSETRGVFHKTADIIAEVLGASAFRVIDRDGNPLERNINRALYDAQMLVFSRIDPNEAMLAAGPIVSSLGGLFEDDEFQNAIRRATGDRSRLHTRVRLTAKALAACGVQVPQELLNP